MLRALVDELGPEYEALLEGAMEDETDTDVAGADNGDSDVLLAAASDQIKRRWWNRKMKTRRTKGCPSDQVESQVF